MNGNALDELARRCDLDALDEELSGLPAKYREPLVLHYLLAKTARETAAELGLSVRTVEGRLRRGKSELRYRLVRRGVSLAVVGGVIAKGHAAGGAVAATLVNDTINSGLTFASGKVTSHAASLAAEELSTMSTVGIPSSFVAAVLAAILLIGGTEREHFQSIPGAPHFNFGVTGPAAFGGGNDQRTIFTLADAEEADDQIRQAEAATDTEDNRSQPAADESERGEDDLPGRNYLSVHIGMPHVDDFNRVLGVIGVDPNTGEWDIVSGARGEMEVLPGGKQALFAMFDRTTDQNRLVLFDMQSKTEQYLGDYFRAIPSRDGKATIVTQTQWPTSNGDGGLPLSTGSKYWRLDLATLKKEPLPIPRDYMLLDASGDLDWCLMLRTIVKPGESQATIPRITQRIIAMKSDGSEQRPLLAQDSSSHGSARFAPSGEKVAYIARPQDEPAMISIVDFDGQNARTVYESQQIDHFPESLCWPPDGKNLLAIIGEHTEGARNYRLLVIDVESGAQRGITLKDAQVLSLRNPNWR